MMNQLLSISLLPFFYAFGFSQTEKFEHNLRSRIEGDWHLYTVDTLNYSHPMLKHGEFLKEVYIHNSNDTLKYILYNSSDSIFKNEIQMFHQLRNCSYKEDNYDSKTYCFEGFYMFLPVYPCPDSYSESCKIIIDKICND